MNGAQIGALAGFEAFKSIARVNIISGLASFPLVVVGVWRGGLEGAIWGTVGALAINWVLNHRALRVECVRTNISYRFANCHEELGILHRFTLPAFLASIIVGPAIWACNALLVRQPGGYAELGLYAAADKWRLLILFVPISVFNLVVPVLSNLHGEGDSAGFQKVFRTNLKLNVGLALFGGYCDIHVCHSDHDGLWSFIPRWKSRAHRSRLSACLEILNTILGQPLIAAHKMWLRFEFDLLLVTVLLGFGRVLIPKWGAMGLAVSYMLAFAATSLGFFLFLRGDSIFSAHS